MSQDCINLNSFLNQNQNINCCNDSYTTNLVKVKCENDSIISLEINNYSEKLDFNKFPQFQKLTYMNLSNNNLTEIPIQIFNLPHLEELHLKNNHIKEIKKKDFIFNSLIVLDLENNELHNDFFNCIQYFPQLKYLDFSLNGNIDEIPDSSLNYLKHLTYLNLKDTKIEQLPNNIDKLNNLNSLILSNTNLRSLPSNLFKLKNLKYFDISDNPKLSTTIINFKSKVDKCFFNNVDIKCYQLGTCNNIDQTESGQYELCTLDDVNSFKDDKNRIGFKIKISGDSIFEFIVFCCVVVLIALSSIFVTIKCIHLHERKKERSHLHRFNEYNDKDNNDNINNNNNNDYNQIEEYNFISSSPDDPTEANIYNAHPINLDPNGILSPINNDHYINSFDISNMDYGASTNNDNDDIPPYSLLPNNTNNTNINDESIGTSTTTVTNNNNNNQQRNSVTKQNELMISDIYNAYPPQPLISIMNNGNSDEENNNNSNSDNNNNNINTNNAISNDNNRIRQYRYSNENSNSILPSYNEIIGNSS